MLLTPPHLHDGSRWRGKRVGLLGGSFNPPHPGHLHISIQALNSLKLDYIWWLVTPHNPLKQKADLMDYDRRLALCRDIVRHPRILVTDLENQLGMNRTYNVIKALKYNFPATQFVFITGMDNALIFHKWWRWRDILTEVATAHITRPPAEGLIEKCPLRMMSSQNHHFVHTAQRACLRPGHTYWLLQKKMIMVSSTEIRKNVLV